ncbi:MAG TPA: hypothetical protein ENN05_09995 [Deltaproteobacteria bacterium]|nr:hypothetical protein [Deltaproteobacteria bacterium]
MARIITQTFEDTEGKEAGLAVIARACLVLGIGSVFVCIVLVILRAEFFWLAYGAVSMVFCAVCYLIFSALSEIIVLLKRLCGIPCSSAVSGTKTGTIYLCSQCGSMAWADSIKCEGCGEEFNSGDDQDTD